MDKKYLIILIIVALLAGGFFIYQNRKTEEDLKTHHTKQYNRMIEIAKKSSAAGLVHMGRALNKYREEKGAYPDSLSALYPDYIPVKAFIDDIQWHYEPRGEDFYLTKTIKKAGNKVLMTAIESDLRPQVESDVVVASSDEPAKARAKTEIKSLPKIPQKSITHAAAKKPKLIAKKVAPDDRSTSRQTPPGKAGDSQKPPESALPDLEPVPAQKLSEKEHFVQGLSRENFLVWKNDDGTLGFGNVQYPISQKTKIYDKGGWFEIHGERPNS